jgi:hypothetical protein
VLPETTKKLQAQTDRARILGSCSLAWRAGATTTELWAAARDGNRWMEWFEQTNGVNGQWWAAGVATVY